jgi:hypothetical protein
MRRPRIGFRCFFLIVTLASLALAAFAIRARTTTFESAQGHARLAHQIRLHLPQYDVNTYDASHMDPLWEWKTPPFVSHEWAAGCNLQVLPPVRSVEEFPARGRDLIVVGDDYGVLQIRIFDDAGRMVVDISEGRSANAAHDQRVNDLKLRLVDLAPPHEITGAENAEVITAATSIVNSCRANLLAEWKSGVAHAKALYTKAVAEAELHERLARSGRP